MTTTSQDRSLTTTVDIDGTPENVFEALTTTAGITGWWGDTEGSAALGHEFTITFPVSRFVFRVGDAQPGRRVQWDAVDVGTEREWVGTSVTFDLSPTAGGTRVTFRHVGLVPGMDCFDHCSGAWDMFVRTSLKAYVETGTGTPVGMCRQS